jgi:Mg-chelatase subunit ChlD
MAHFICPITQVTMTDPVIAQDGHTYERSAIKEWLKNNDKSPMTREKMGKTLIVNHAMRSELSAAGHPVKSLITNVSTTIDKGNSLRVTLVLDVSGSMSGSVENKQSNEPSFSRLDLIKHAVASIAGMMRDSDQLSIVTFNESSRLVMQWTKMDDAGKDRALEVSKALCPSGGTNIPAGLEAGLQQLGDHTILLTDGANMVPPPRGTLGEYIVSRATSYPGKIHSVGLGMAYDLDTPTLRAASSSKGGLYCFCPDASMVGTVFIHLMANICINEPGVPFDQHAEFVQVLVQSINLFGIGRRTEALNLVRNTKFNNPVLNEELISLDPNKGQVEKALVNWESWGRHFLPAFTDAHIRCVTTNFKDASLQDYATPNTRSFIEYGEGVFLGITPPVPSCNNYSRTTYTAMQFATATMDSQGICFGPETKFSIRSPVEQSKMVPIKDIRKGMYIASQNIVTKVLCLIVSPVTDMVKLGGVDGFWVSRKHPVLKKQPGKVPSWAHAETFEHDSEIQKHKCYNLVLESGHVVSAVTDSGVEFEAVTLGHGKTGGIVEHDYLGTSKIIDDLRKCKGWEAGYIELKGLRRNNAGIYGIEEA